MSLETYTGYIKDMVDTNPSGGDPKSQGDDHLRGIKYTLQVQFSGLTTATPVTVTAEQINRVVAADANASAALARANACLPKDGSEDMTGRLRAIGSVVAMSPVGTPAALRVSATNALREFAWTMGATETNLVLADDAGTQRAAVRLPLDGAGAPVSSVFGVAGRPSFLDASAPATNAGGSEIATAGWVRGRSLIGIGVGAPSRDWTSIPKVGWKTYAVLLDDKLVVVQYVAGGVTYSASATSGARSVFVRVDDSGFYGFSVITSNGSDQQPATIAAIHWG